LKIPAFITVRTASSRLPQKCLLPFGDYNVIEHIIHRAKYYQLEPIICTSTESSDDILEKIAQNEGVKVFRGSMVNKLKRWYDCCNHFGIGSFHTVDADDPFFDGDEIKKSIALLHEGYDMVSPTVASSSGGASVGYSITKEIIAKACAVISEDEDTEMMWYYINQVDGIKKIVLPGIDSDSLAIRLTLDYEEDYWLLLTIQRILGNLTSRKEVNNLFKRNPDLFKVNWFRNEEWSNNQKKKKI
jgi:spore coat polysaccharide biosynthesis protein SpsF